MGGVRVKYTHLFKGKWRWIPPPWMRGLGATAETLTEGEEFTGKALDRSRELTAFWTAAKTEGAKAGPAPHTMSWLIREYEQSSWYAKLGKRTKENVDASMRDIDAALGRFMVARLERKNCRSFYEGVLKKRGPHVAKTRLTWLRRLLSWANEIGERADNPARKMEAVEARPRRQRWQGDEIARVVKSAKELGFSHIVLVVLIGYDTGQRLSDILALTWNDYDGEGLTFSQAKTGAEVWAPLHRGTKALLRRTPRKAVQIVTSPHTGQPYTSRVQVERDFRKAARRAGIPDTVQMRDLRRTVASEISAGGQKIHSITGHAPGSTMERVYIVPDRDAARAAQKARKRNKV